MKIEDITQSEWDLLGKGITYPENEEWFDDYDGVLESAIGEWKAASKYNKEQFLKGDAFYKMINPSLSDDDWDYIQPFYTYMSMKSILRTPSKFFGPIMKKVIIQSIFESLEDTEADFESLARSAWNKNDPGPLQVKASTLKELTQRGRVTEQFAKSMRPYEDDDEAWEAIEAFYDSGNKYF